MRYKFIIKIRIYIYIQNDFEYTSLTSKNLEVMYKNNCQKAHVNNMIQQELMFGFSLLLIIEK